MAIIGAVFAMSAVMPAQAQTPVPTRGAAANGSPGWELVPAFKNGGGYIVGPGGSVTLPQRAPRTPGAPPAARPPVDPAVVQVPGCRRTIVCDNRNGPNRSDLLRVEWDQTLNYKVSYPFDIPQGTGAPSVGIDSKGSVWVLQRRQPGPSQLFKYSNNKKVLEVPQSEIGYQSKAHGTAVDAQDNVWITDTAGATVQKISPEGKLLLTIGVRGKRGDWDESKGQRLLWEPVMVAFDTRNGDFLIAEGHANESPNDVDSDDPANQLGAARILRFDKDGKFKSQIIGSNAGQGKFDSAHGFAIDPQNGDIWIGDREQYRIVIYNSEGRHLRTIQMRNLVCAIQFDPAGNPWIATGHDGQFLKLDRTGKVLGAVGLGEGIAAGEYHEASYFVFDKQFGIWAGDTAISRVSHWTVGQ